MDGITGGTLVLYTLLVVVGFVTLTLPYSLRYMRKQSRALLSGLDAELATVGAVRDVTVGRTGRVQLWLAVGSRRCDVTLVPRQDKHGRRWVNWTAAVHPVDAGRRVAFTLGRAGYASLLRNAAGWRDVEVGEHTFDLDFDLYADRPEAAQALFGDGGVRSAVRTWFGPVDRGLHVSLDEMNILEARQDHATPTSLPDHLRHLVALADALDAAHDELGPGGQRDDVPAPRARPGPAVASPSSHPVSVPGPAPSE